MVRLFALISFMGIVAFAQTAPVGATPAQTTEVYADLGLLKYLNIPVLAQDARVNLGYAVLTPEQQEHLVEFNHTLNRCGGFEALMPAPAAVRVAQMASLTNHVAADSRWGQFLPRQMAALPKRPEIDAALAEIQIQNLKDFVVWASSFPNRYNRSKDPDIAVHAFVPKLQQMLARMGRGNLQVEVIGHKSTAQHSIRVRLPGKTRPQEVIVLGAHFDSINVNPFITTAPGADDNASGSANILEVLRILAAHGPLDRTVEFYWYAGEESGLLGSAEIAQDAKAANRQIVAVLQLDMTLHPGAGELVLGSMTDFTSSWLRDFLVAANQTYLNVKIVEDKCGYGCSDHASWYRQGYPTLMPFEATMQTMNHRLHTANDVINPQSSFEHSMIFARIAMIFAMELGNSDAHQPYQTVGF